MSLLEVPLSPTFSATVTPLRTTVTLPTTIWTLPIGGKPGVGCAWAYSPGLVIQPRDRQQLHVGDDNVIAT